MVNDYKLQSYSCDMKDGNLYFFSLLGDLFSFNLDSNCVTLVGEINDTLKIPSVYNIFIIKDNIYRIDNSGYQIVDSEGKACVILNELKKENTFLWFGRKYYEKIIMFDGNGNFYFNINVETGSYEIEKLEDIKCAFALNDSAIFVDVNNKILLYPYSTRKIRILADIKNNIDAVAESEMDYFFLDESGNLFKINKFNNTMEMIISIDKNMKFKKMQYIDNTLVMLPREKESGILVIYLKDKTVERKSFPKNVMYFENATVLFDRCFENDEIIIYPMRGISSFLKINKKEHELEWIKPNNIDDIKINMKNKINRFNYPLEEGSLTLDDFIQGLV